MECDQGLIGPGLEWMSDVCQAYRVLLQINFSKALLFLNIQLRQPPLTLVSWQHSTAFPSNSAPTCINHWSIPSPRIGRLRINPGSQARKCSNVCRKQKFCVSLWLPSGGFHRSLVYQKSVKSKTNKNVQLTRKQQLKNDGRQEHLHVLWWSWDSCKSGWDSRWLLFISPLSTLMVLSKLLLIDVKRQIRLLHSLLLIVLLILLIRVL